MNSEELQAGDRVSPIRGPLAGRLGTVREVTRDAKNGYVSVAVKFKGIRFPQPYSLDNLLVQEKLAPEPAKPTAVGDPFQGFQPNTIYHTVGNRDNINDAKRLAEIDANFYTTVRAYLQMPMHYGGCGGRWDYPAALIGPDGTRYEWEYGRGWVATNPAKEKEAKRIADEANDAQREFTVTELATMDDVAKETKKNEEAWSLDIMVLRAELRDEMEARDAESRAKVLHAVEELDARLQRVVKTERANVRREVAKQVHEELKIIKAALTIAKPAESGWDTSQARIDEFQEILDQIHAWAYEPGRFQGNTALQTVHEALAAWFVRTVQARNPVDAPTTQNKGTVGDASAKNALDPASVHSSALEG